MVMPLHWPCAHSPPSEPALKIVPPATITVGWNPDGPYIVQLGRGGPDAGYRNVGAVKNCNPALVGIECGMRDEDFSIGALAIALV